MFKHILLPTDGSEPSLRAVEMGAALAKSVGAEVTLMMVAERFSISPLVNAYGADVDQMCESAHSAAAHWLAAAQAVVDKYGVKSSQVIMQQGNVHQRILELAQTTKADLIVMGTHGAGAFERLILGSQTQRVLAHTTIPVMVLH